MVTIYVSKFDRLFDVNNKPVTYNGAYFKCEYVNGSPPGKYVLTVDGQSVCLPTSYQAIQNYLAKKGDVVVILYT